MKFWRLVAQGQFRQGWEILSRRPDSEHEQALIRVVITTVVFLYLYVGFSHDGVFTPIEVQLQYLCGFYWLLSIVLFGAIVAKPAISRERRVIGICGDLGLSCYAIAHLDGGGGVLYVVLLWVIFGNGFRYGRNYLFASAAIGVAGFSLAIWRNEYWNGKLL
ncbi:MAG TPA: hypothetical protein VFT11_05260, partial [Candidatus Deferrimicrobiaceae bacterium]|nr:hypothetical protein [Candidatus Deferrimicrobiaceae bacterium]